MSDFIFRANIAHFLELLKHETDTHKAATLRSLLAEERAKLEDWQARQKPPRAAE
jgi:hypothetical protein